MKKEVLAGNAPAPIGPYSQAVQAGEFLFVSGQIPIIPETGEMEKGDMEAQAKRVMENIKAVLDKAGFSFDDVIKTTIYLVDISGFPAVNRIYETYVTKPYPARATVEVSKLPKGALIEIETVAYKKGFASMPGC